MAAAPPPRPYWLMADPLARPDASVAAAAAAAAAEVCDDDDDDEEEEEDEAEEGEEACTAACTAGGRRRVARVMLELLRGDFEMEGLDELHFRRDAAGISGS